MFGRISTTKSTGSCLDNIEKLKKALKEADAVVIGAGAGLSTSAGFTYSGERFRKYFSDFEEEYGFHDMYSGGFHVMQLEPEVSWAYWARNIYINRYMDAPKPVYKRIMELVKDKDHFVLTTNVDHCFQKAPGIIKYPFWKMTAKNPEAVYACINYGEAVCPDEIKEQPICIDGDIGTVIEDLM